VSFLKITRAIVDEVIELANRCQYSNEQFSMKFFPEGMVLSDYGKYRNTYEYQKSEEDYKALESYLNTLEYDVIKDLLTLMYLGRDYLNADDDDLPKNAKKTFQKMRLESNLFTSKSVDINQMLEKSPLGQYLSKGADLLNL